MIFLNLLKAGDFLCISLVAIKGGIEGGGVSVFGMIEY